MSKKPEVTVFMPVYNAERYLREAIESILNQTFSDFELLIVNDGSTDKSVEIVESYKDERIRLVHNDGNKGLPYTRNRGLELAQGKYMAIMDADDVSVKERLQIQYEIMEKKKDLVVLASGKELLSEDGKDTYGPKEKLFSLLFYGKSNQIQMDLMFHNVLVNSSTMIRLDFLKKNKIQYNEKCFVMQDYEMWTQIAACNGQMQLLRKALVKYRTHQENITSRSRKEKAERRRTIQHDIQKNYLKQIQMGNNNEVLDLLQVMGREFEEQDSEVTEKYLLELKRFYVLVLKNVRASKHFTYKEMKSYLRKKYFLQALKCKENRFKNCIKVFSVA